MSNIAPTIPGECHPERSEGSGDSRAARCFASLSMTIRCVLRFSKNGDLRGLAQWIVLFFLCLATLGLSATYARAADDDPPPNLLKPRPHGPAKGLAGVGLTGQQVNAAIEKGSEGLWKWLLAQDLTNDASFGYRDEHVLCALALV